MTCCSYLLLYSGYWNPRVSSEIGQNESAMKFFYLHGLAADHNIQARGKVLQYGPVYVDE
jgi:hypothetical protein